MIGLDEIPGLHLDVLAAGGVCGGTEVIEKVRQLEADGGTSIEWSTASSWTVVNATPITPPSALDDVVIGGGAITNQPSITSTTVAVTIKSLTFEVGNGADNEDCCRDRQLGDGHHPDAILAKLDDSVKLFPAQDTNDDSRGHLGCLIFKPLMLLDSSEESK
jgi:hypothetical protein